MKLNELVDRWHSVAVTASSRCDEDHPCYEDGISTAFRECADSLGNAVPEIEEEMEELRKSNDRLKVALSRIREFGYREAGRGDACARMADDALGEEVK